MKWSRWATWAEIWVDSMDEAMKVRSWWDCAVRARLHLLRPPGETEEGEEVVGGREEVTWTLHGGWSVRRAIRDGQSVLL